MRRDLLTVTSDGLYCAAGDFHVDPWRPVKRAVVTHAHSDHARPGHGAYLTAAPGDRSRLFVCEQGGLVRIIRGGSFRSELRESRTYHRSAALFDERSEMIGFRCAADAEPVPAD